MPLRSPQQYLESLRDGRRVYYRGQRVEDVTTHPVIGVAARHAATDYEMAEDEAYRDLAVVDGLSRYYVAPQTTDDLLARSRICLIVWAASSSFGSCSRRRPATA